MVQAEQAEPVDLEQPEQVWVAMVVKVAEELIANN
jgi:hypothetical protein